MGSSIEVAGPYTLHIAAVLWLIVIVMLVIERRRTIKNRKK